jgi:hypothetical protein
VTEEGFEAALAAVALSRACLIPSVTLITCTSLLIPSLAGDLGCSPLCVELSVHAALFLSLILLQEAIQAMSRSWFGGDMEDLAAGLPVRDLMFLKVRLRANYWCESHIETYSNIPSGPYFLGLLPLRRKKDHSHCCERLEKR